MLQRIESLPHEQFLAMLLQRRFSSLIFSTVYDIGIDGLSDHAAIKLARQIAREEYPDPSGDIPSHREDLIHDLIVLGTTKAKILASRPTASTSSALLDTVRLIADASTEADDVRILAMLRFWGEVVVSVEYGEFWKRMAARFDGAGVPSRFYHEHYGHDGREPLSTASQESSTHSGRMGACLKRLLNAPGADAAFAEVETHVVEMRLRFYDQFL